MAVDITGKPIGAVSSLVIARGEGHRVEGTWKVTDWLKSEDNRVRATRLTLRWTLGIPGSDPRRYDVKNTTDLDGWTVNLNTFTIGRTTYTRNSFYPLNSKRKLSYVTLRVTAGNDKGDSEKQPMVTLTFRKPKKPSIAAFTMSEAGQVRTTITTPEDAGLYERYDTEYYFKVIRRDNGAVFRDVHTTSTSTSIPLSINLTGYQSLPQGSYIRCKVTARARGYAGASEWVSKTFYVGYPNRPSVTSINIKSKKASSRVTVRVKTNRTEYHPITRVQLEALKNTEYETEAEVSAATEDWTQIGVADDGYCTALTCLVDDIACSPGRWSWVRIKSWYLVEGALVTYSKPVRVDKLHTNAATHTNDSVEIIDSSSGEDGTTVNVTLAWAPTGTTDTSTGTELSWSDQLDTWRSTDEPHLFELTYDDGPVTYEEVDYASSATIAIKGLEQGATTYVRARRYKDVDSGRIYGPYGNTEIVIPSVAPASVTLEAPGYVPEGQGVTCQWTFEGTSAQTAWQLRATTGEVIENGENALGAATISASRAESIAVDGSFSVLVAVSTGGDWVLSDPVTVHIVQRPDVTVTPSATYTAQPVAVPVACETADASLTVIVTSRGTDGDGPGGMVLQAEGDVVWSGVVLPEWSEGTATVTLPEGLAFVDGTQYDISVTATDPSTGLSSDEATGTFGVAWSHQAPDPAGSVTATPIDTVDADGNHIQAVTLTLTAPTGSVETDVYDIYRLTGDGAQLIGQSWPLASTATDVYAPYGAGVEHAYRVACRTADGDVAWADVPYAMGGSALRIDWQGGTVELPYDLAISDGYGKDVDVHTYLDGSTDAFYNQGVKRTATLATNVLRLQDADTIAAVKALARFVGPAFVRTPDGSAYEADVQVTDLTPTYELSAVSISATEVALTPAYTLPPFEVDDETDESEG